MKNDKFLQWPYKITHELVDEGAEKKSTQRRHAVKEIKIQIKIGKNKRLKTMMKRITQLHHKKPPFSITSI